MTEANDTAGMIYQNLIDAGFDQQTAETCMSIVKKGSCVEMLPILSKQRVSLLSTVHSDRKSVV